MRRVLMFVLACTLLIAGVYLLYLQLFVSRVMWWGSILAGAAWVGVGCHLLWVDFIAPSAKDGEK